MEKSMLEKSKKTNLKFDNCNVLLKAILIHTDRKLFNLQYLTILCYISYPQ